MCCLFGVFLSAHTVCCIVLLSYQSTRPCCTKCSLSGALSLPSVSVVMLYVPVTHTIYCVSLHAQPRTHARPPLLPPLHPDHAPLAGLCLRQLPEHGARLHCHGQPELHSHPRPALPHHVGAARPKPAQDRCGEHLCEEPCPRGGHAQLVRHLLSVWQHPVMQGGDRPTDRRLTGK